MSKHTKCVCPKTYKELKHLLPLLKSQILNLIDRQPLVSGILLSHLCDVINFALKVESYLEKIEEELSPDEIEEIEKQIIDAADCPAEFHFKKAQKARKRRHSATC